MSAPITERQFQAQVEQFAKLRGWLFIHQRDSRGSNPGFPDIFALRRERAVALELKVGKNQPTIEQRVWLEAMKQAGIEAHLIYPEDFEKWSAILT